MRNSTTEQLKTRQSELERALANVRFELDRRIEAQPVITIGINKNHHLEIGVTGQYTTFIPLSHTDRRDLLYVLPKIGELLRCAIETKARVKITTP